MLVPEELDSHVSSPYTALPIVLNKKNKNN